ncbi:MAG TPA: hypothetical protein VMS23_07605, partial [Terrimicrobiaceae bacterium]|nr:hypothetical protein [Terrimicrobiaceae bacterium]
MVAQDSFLSAVPEIPDSDLAAGPARRLPDDQEQIAMGLAGIEPCLLGGAVFEANRVSDQAIGLRVEDDNLATPR